MEFVHTRFLVFFKEVTMDEWNKKGFHNYSVFEKPEEALAKIREIYEKGIARKISAAERLQNKKSVLDSELTGRYPLLGFSIENSIPNISGTESYGICRRGAGVYASTLTQPNLLETYWLENLKKMQETHPDGQIAVGVSSKEIPIEFALNTKEYSPEVIEKFTQRGRLKNGVLWGNQEEFGDFPLAPFPAVETDNGISRLLYYLGLKKPDDVQETVLLTNYDEFLYAFKDYVEKDRKEKDLVIPESFTAKGREANMEHRPFAAFSLKKPGRKGITVIRIGIGASNACTLVTYLAMTRPRLILMVGHCASGRPHWQQKIGSYVLGRSFHRNSCPLAEPGVGLVPLETKIPEIDEVNNSLYWAVGKEHKLSKKDTPSILTGGNIVSVSYRPWDDLESAWDKFAIHKPVGIEMETGTVVAAGYYYRVPYGACHVVTDHPIEGRVKTKMDARANTSVRDHLNIVLRAVNRLNENPDQYASRSIGDSWLDPPFR